MNRTRIYLDAEQAAKLDKLAATERTTRSTVIRRAVDAYLAQEQDVAAWREQWQEAVAGSAGMAPYLEDGVEYVDNLRRIDAERLAEIQR